MKEKRMSAKKVIVVGAGPGGLTSAMILAHRGFDVTVFEKEPVVGGRNAQLKLNGFTFDTGPTFLMMNFILKEMFEETGKKAEDYLTAKKLDPMYHLIYSDFELQITDNRNAMQQQLETLFPGSIPGYEKFLTKESIRFKKLFPCLQKPYSHLLDYCDRRFIRAIPYFSLGNTMFRELGKYFDQTALKVSFTFQSKYLGMSPWECPAAYTMVPFIEHEYGIYHVIGGLNAISLAMEKVLIEEGGTIHKSTPVKKIIKEGTAVTGVELTNGEKHYADDVIINADFAHTMENMFEHGTLQKYTRDRLERLKLSCSTFMLYLGVNKVYDMPHHNIFFTRDYKSNIDDIVKNKKLSQENSFYIQNAVVSDQTLAPAGKSTIYILVPVPNNRAGINWEEERDHFRDQVLDQVEQKTKLKDLRQHIEAEKIITPAEWEQDYNIYEAATFNLAHNLSQMLYLRPRNKFEECDNLYLVGGGTHPGSGLPTIYESGRISSNLLCDKYGVTYKPPSALYAKQTFA
jgi:phytoene desaturase